jgi:hypothetical protein
MERVRWSCTDPNLPDPNKDSLVVAGVKSFSVQQATFDDKVDVPSLFE